MQDNRVEDMSFKEAISQFGSLKEAIRNLRAESLVLQRQNERLKQENRELREARDMMNNALNMADKELKNQRQTLSELVEKFEANSRQYRLFESFVSMLFTSPSKTTLFPYIADLFKDLATKGWITNLSVVELTSVFIKAVMGDYLQSFKCENCGAKFIVNKKPDNVWKTYCCPACNISYTVKADDSFLKLMVSEEQINNTILAEKLLEENEVLKPFKSLLEIPCEICNKPVSVWTEFNLKLLIQGTGCGHVECWNSESGRLVQMAKALKKLKA